MTEPGWLGCTQCQPQCFDIESDLEGVGGWLRDPKARREKWDGGAVEKWLKELWRKKVEGKPAWWRLEVDKNDDAGLEGKDMRGRCERREMGVEEEAEIQK